jgi:O-antigen/teichoic acid export membrane protein
MDYLKIIKNTSYLAYGTAIVSVINFISVPIVTKHLGISNYGIYSSILSFVGLFRTFSLIGNQKVLFRTAKNSRSDLVKSINSIIGIQNVVSVISIFITILSSFFIDSFNYNIIITISIYSFTNLIFPLRRFTNTIHLFNDKFKTVSILNVLNRLLFSVFAIFLVYFDFGYTAIIYVNLSVNILLIVINYLYLIERRYRYNIFSKPLFNIDFLKPHLKFHIISVLNYFQTNVDILMLTIMGTFEEVAIYAVGHKLASFTGRLRSIFSTALFPEVIKMTKEKTIEIKQLYRPTIIFGLIGLTIIILFTFVSEPLIIMFFGSDFSQSAEILNVLIFYIFFGWLSLPFNTLLLSYESNDTKILITNIICAIANIFLNKVLYDVYGLLGIAYATLFLKIFIIPIAFSLIILSMKKNNIIT